MTAPCPHGMPSPASCLDCIDEVGLGPMPRWLAASGAEEGGSTSVPAGDWTEVRNDFEGTRCTSCGETIALGERFLLRPVLSTTPRPGGQQRRGWERQCQTCKPEADE